MWFHKLVKSEISSLYVQVTSLHKNAVCVFCHTHSLVSDSCLYGHRLNYSITLCCPCLQKSRKSYHIYFRFIFNIKLCRSSKAVKKFQDHSLGIVLSTLICEMAKVKHIRIFEVVYWYNKSFSLKKSNQFMSHGWVTAYKISQHFLTE